MARLNRSLLSLTLTLAACGGSTTSSTSHDIVMSNGIGQNAEARTEGTRAGRPLTNSERDRIEVFVHQAESMRGLRFRSPVNVSVQTAAEIRAAMEEELEDDEILKSQALYRAIGLLRPSDDARSILLDVTEEQVVGYYAPKHKQLVLRDDVFDADGPMSRMARGLQEPGTMVIVHELVHALQDQYFDGLQERFDSLETSDANNAYHAVVEGDATLAMLAPLAAQAHVPFSDVAARFSRMSGSQLESLASRDNERSARLRSAPAIMRVTLESAYSDGLLFCAHRYLVNEWAGVDASHRSPPISSEQIIHPQKYATHEPPDSTDGFSIAALTNNGFVKTQDDVLGELEMSVFFALGTQHDRDRACGAGWSGDKLYVLRNPVGDVAVAWVSAWDGEPDAREAETCARRSLLAARNGEASPLDSVQRIGRTVLILRDVPPALQPPLAQAHVAYERSLPHRALAQTTPL